MAKRKPKGIESIEDLTPDRRNANKGTVRGRGAVGYSLANLGAGRSVLVDRDGEIIAGNKTVEAAADLELPIRVVTTDGNELVVVQRTDLDLDGDGGRARKLAYADNRAAELGLEWDADIIAGDLEAEDIDLSDLFTDGELAEVMAGMDVALGGGQDVAEPETTISPELHERHDYLVLYFDNGVDWLGACELFGIETVKAPLPGKDGDRMHKRGIGRVIRGDVVLRTMMEAGIASLSAYGGDDTGDEGDDG